MNTAPTKALTTIRLSPELMERVKRHAKREHRSFNSFVENVLDRATEPVFPKLGPDFKVSDEIRSFQGSVQFKRPSQKEIDADPKLAYLVKKFGL